MHDSRTTNHALYKIIVNAKGDWLVLRWHDRAFVEASRKFLDSLNQPPRRRCEHVQPFSGDPEAVQYAALAVDHVKSLSRAGCDQGDMGYEVSKPLRLGDESEKR